MSPASASRRVLVAGTGAMACLVGARLARFCGLEVTLAGSWTDGLEALRRTGVTVEEGGGCWTARVRAVPIAGELEPAELVLVLVKAWRTAAVAVHVARAAEAAGLILTLQNGLGNRERLAAASPEAPVGIGITSMGATLLGPGRVRAGGAGETALGDVPGARDAVSRARDWLSVAGMPAEIRPDIDALLWRKLAVNCAINPVSALLRLPNGALLDDAAARETMALAAREVAAVASAKGIAFGGDPVELVLGVARATAGNLSSMLQDVLRGARTEIDQLNGAVVAEARKVGIEVPINRRLWREVAGLRIGAGGGA